MSEDKPHAMLHSPKVKKDAESGRELHREFVGMLFALAIAEVAVQAAQVVNSGLPFSQCLPAYAHLFLASMMITTSWVGWGRSKHSSSNITAVFTSDFLELLLDLWLVALYFFIVRGVELTESSTLNAVGSPTAGPNTISTQYSITPSLENEVLWSMIVFITYIVWDVVTKVKRDSSRLLFQRGWASLICGTLGVFAYLFRPVTSESSRVVLADLALLSLVFLFRAMKRKDFYKLQKEDRGWIISFMLLFCLFFEASAQFTPFGKTVGNWVSTFIP